MATKLTPSFAKQAEGFGPVREPQFLNHHNGIGVDGDQIGPGGSAAKQWMSVTLANFRKLNERRQYVDPRVTYMVNCDRIGDQIEAFRTQTGEGFAAARRTMASEIAAREKALDDAVAIKPTANAAEIRSVLLQMKPAEREKALRAAADPANPDREVLGAIVGFNKLITGLDPATVGVVVDELKRNVAPMLYRDLEKSKTYSKWLVDSEHHVMSATARAYTGLPQEDAKRAEAMSILASYDFKHED